MSDTKCFYYKKLINEYLNGELSNVEKLSLMEHLDVCFQCKREFEILNKISNMSREVKRFKAPENFEESLRRKIHEKKRKKSKVMEVLLIIAASVVLFITGFLISSNYILTSYHKEKNGFAENKKIEIPKKVKPQEIEIKDSNYKRWKKVYLEEVSH